MQNNHREYEALRLLRHGKLMVLTNVNGRREYIIMPDGIGVNGLVAEKVKRHPDVVGGGDGMFGIDQTWRVFRG